MPPSEKDVVRQIRRWVEGAGGKIIPLQHTALLEAGTPDLLGCYRGVMFLIEVKAPGRKTRKIQDVRIEEWQKVGACVFVVDSVSEFEEQFLDALRSVRTLAASGYYAELYRKTQKRITGRRQRDR